MIALRPLGRSGLRVAPLALGGNVFGWTADEATSFSVLDAFVDAGAHLIDTADVYSRWVPGHAGGESETIIGKWLARRPSVRDRVVIATKVGMDLGDGRSGLAPARIRQACDESLRRLRTDRIDLYQSHVDDPATPLAETLGAYAALIEHGKVRAIGCSNHGAVRLAEALETSRREGLPRYETLQPLFNLCDRARFESELQPLALREGIGVINFYGLAAGFLSGKYRSEADLAQSPRGARVGASYLNERGLRILAALDEVAAAHRSTPAAVALAWQMAQPSIVAPIASATSVAQLQQQLGALTLELCMQDYERLDAASAEAA